MGRKQQSVLPDFPPIPSGIENPLTPDVIQSFIAWQNSGYCEGVQTVDFMRAYLITRVQWDFLTSNFYGLADLLNGRVSGQHVAQINEFFDDWNNKLGAKQFGF